MNMPLPPGYREGHFRQRILQNRRVLAQGMMPGYVARSLDVEIVEEAMSDMLLYRLKALVLCEDLGLREYEAVLDVPASWWQHLKRDHAPGWFLHRWPVRLTQYRQTVKGHGWRGYPDAPIAIPPERMGQPVVFEEFTGGPWQPFC